MVASAVAAKADDAAVAASYKAVETLYHAFFTGLILSTVTRHSVAGAAELMFRTYRRQHLEKFLPGLKKLGLDKLPHAVAAAQYHYLSNQMGGVGVEYIPESDRKAWVRYPPPRWIWYGTAICGIPSEVNRAMLRGWHAHNGVSLGNPRLGFVCTKQTVDGQPGLEGYYYEYDRDLAPEERLRFALEESAPMFDPAKAPYVAERDWPAERLRKALRNYSLDYVRVVIPEILGLLGAAEGGHIAGITARLIGMQYQPETASLLGVEGNGMEALAEYLVRMGRAQDDDTAWHREGAEIVVRQSTWRLMRGIEQPAPGVFEAWNALWEGAASVLDRRIALKVTQRRDLGDPVFEWRLQQRRRPV